MKRKILLLLTVASAGFALDIDPLLKITSCEEKHSHIDLQVRNEKTGLPNALKLKTTDYKIELTAEKSALLKNADLKKADVVVSQIINTTKIQDKGAFSATPYELKKSISFLQIFRAQRHDDNEPIHFKIGAEGSDISFFVKNGESDITRGLSAGKEFQFDQSQNYSIGLEKIAAFLKSKALLYEPLVGRSSKTLLDPEICSYVKSDLVKKNSSYERCLQTMADRQKQVKDFVQRTCNVNGLHLSEVADPNVREFLMSASGNSLNKFLTDTSPLKLIAGTYKMVDPTIDVLPSVASTNATSAITHDLNADASVPPPSTIPGLGSSIRSFFDEPGMD